MVAKMIVLCLNDLPIGVYTMQEKADAAALADWRRRESKWDAQDLLFSESAFASIFGESGSCTYKAWHYHCRTFTADDEARP